MFIIFYALGAVCGIGSMMAIEADVVVEVLRVIGLIYPSALVVVR